jgi:hypothetical protein
MGIIHASSKQITTQRLTVALLLILLGVTRATFGETRDDAANTGFQMLEEPTSPVATGMGSAGTALKSTGFAFYNPALPSLYSSRLLSVEYGQYPAADLDRTHFEAFFPLKNSFLAAGFHTDGIDEIPGRSGEGFPTGDFSDQHSVLSLAAGIRRAERFALAIGVNGIQHRIAEFSAFAASLSGGMIYEAIPGRLTLGAAGFHVGTSTSMDTLKEWGEGAPLPRSARAGFAWSDTLHAKYPYRVSTDVVYRDTDGRITVPAGIEVRPIDALAFRVGKRFGMETELVTAGFGLDIAPLAVDMSFTLPRLVRDNELKWLVGVTYTLGKTREAQKRPDKTETAPVHPRDTLQEEKQTPEQMDSSETEAHTSTATDTIETAPSVQTTETAADTATETAPVQDSVAAVEETTTEETSDTDRGPGIAEDEAGEQHGDTATEPVEPKPEQQSDKKLRESAIPDENATNSSPQPHPGDTAGIVAPDRPE